MREMEPKGLKSSCRSVSRVSSDRLVTRMVALSSARNQARRISCEWPGELGPYPQDNHWVLGGACPQASIRVPSLPHLCGWAAWTPHGGWPRPAGSVARTSLSCSGLPGQAPALETKSTAGSVLTLAQQRDRTTQDAGSFSPDPA